jgi:hypothetical protein
MNCPEQLISALEISTYENSMCLSLLIRFYFLSEGYNKMDKRIILSFVETQEEM